MTPTLAIICYSIAGALLWAGGYYTGKKASKAPKTDAQRLVLDRCPSAVCMSLPVGFVIAGTGLDRQGRLGRTEAEAWTLTARAYLRKEKRI